MKFILCLILTACASQPTFETIQADLVKIQSDLQIVASKSNPVIQNATAVAGVVETVSGNSALVPLTNAVSSAVQAANIAVASQTPHAN